MRAGFPQQVKFVWLAEAHGSGHVEQLSSCYGTVGIESIFHAQISNNCIFVVSSVRNVVASTFEYKIDLSTKPSPQPLERFHHLSYLAPQSAQFPPSVALASTLRLPGYDSVSLRPPRHGRSSYL